MKINALLDVSLVAHEAEDEITAMLEVEAPAALAADARPQASLQVVLDRSGSMTGAPLDGAKRALVALVRRLEPTDNFGLVTFDDDAAVVVAAGPLADKETVIARIQAVRAGGSTDLGAGYLRGLRELRRVIGAAGGTVLVISDGHVNAGITGAAEFDAITSKAYSEGIVTSTLGYGRGYDETLLAAIARAGNGNHVFADNPDAAGAAVMGEVDGLLNKVVQAASLTVRVEPAVEMVRLYNDVPVQLIAAGQVMIELGDLYAGESRKLLLKVKVPAMAALGPARVATLELVYVELPALIEQVASLPVNVNVVPGDEAAARVPHPTVRSEALFQEAQQSKRRASEAFEAGEVEAGRRLLGETKDWLGSALAIAPDAMSADIQADLVEVNALDERLDVAGTGYASKMTRESYHRANRKRGRSR